MIRARVCLRTGSLNSSRQTTISALYDDRAVTRRDHLQVGPDIPARVEVGEDVGEQFGVGAGWPTVGPWSGTTMTFTVPGARTIAA